MPEWLEPNVVFEENLIAADRNPACNDARHRNDPHQDAENGNVSDHARAEA
ncbi:MAG: hypothetical protein ABW003_03835 [Microvirga sp.]